MRIRDWLQTVRHIEVSSVTARQVVSLRMYAKMYPLFETNPGMPPRQQINQQID